MRDRIQKKRGRRGAQAALALALVIGTVHFQPVMASTIQDANEKKDEAQSGLSSTQRDIGRIEDEQASLQQEINALDTELVNVIMNLNILKDDLRAKSEELVEVQDNLVQAQADEDKQYDAMKKRIRFMYEKGDSALLTSILESRSITDLLNRVEYVNEVYDYDRDLLETYQATKQRVADLEVQVEGEIAELKEVQANYQEEQERYETVIAQKRSQMSDFDVQLANAVQLAAQYQATIDEQNEIIRQEEERLRKEEEERKKKEAEERRKAQEAAIAAANRNNAASAANNSANTSGGSGGNSGSGGGSNASGGSGGGSGASGDSGASGGTSTSGGNKNPGYSTGVSGGSIIDYACSFIGKPYVWGGTDPNTGADCSGFIQYVYRKFGISLPRSSYDQRNAGKEVSYSNAQPGDIICYSGHVAIYMGGGQIVHASNPAAYPAGGIKTGTATYRTIISVRRVL